MEVGDYFKGNWVYTDKSLNSINVVFNTCHINQRIKEEEGKRRGDRRAARWAERMNEHKEK